MSFKRIMLIGYMGSGKTTLGAELCKLTGSRFIDMDKEIERIEAMSIKKIFMKFGEHEFRNKEAELLDKLCNVTSAIDIMTGGDGAIKKMMDKASKYSEFENLDKKESKGIVVSCGGGIILDDINCQILKKEITIFLDGSLELLFSRIKKASHRPLAFMETTSGEERFEKFAQLYKTREDLYRNTATITINLIDEKGKEKTPEILAKEIVCCNNFKASHYSS